MAKGVGDQRRGEYVLTHLRDQIVSGTLQGGERIDQDELAAELKVSRTPIREALLRLEKEGLVDNVPYRGAVVRPITAAFLEEIYALRIHLEGLAARLGAPAITDETLAEMEHAARQLELESAPGHLEALIDYNRDFHFGLYESAGSSELIRLIEPAFNHAERLRLFFKVEDEGPVIEQHRAMLEACRRRDPVSAELAVRFHLIGAVGLMAAGRSEVGDLRLLPRVLSGAEMEWLTEIIEGGAARMTLPAALRDLIQTPRRRGGRRAEGVN